MFERKSLLSKEIPSRRPRLDEKVMLMGHHLIPIKYWTKGPLSPEAMASRSPLVFSFHV